MRITNQQRAAIVGKAIKKIAESDEKVSRYRSMVIDLYSASAEAIYSEPVKRWIKECPDKSMLTRIDSPRYDWTKRAINPDMVEDISKAVPIGKTVPATMAPDRLILSRSGLSVAPVFVLADKAMMYYIEVCETSDNIKQMADEVNKESDAIFGKYLEATRTIVSALMSCSTLKMLEDRYPELAELADKTTTGDQRAIAVPPGRIRSLLCGAGALK